MESLEVISVFTARATYCEPRVSSFRWIEITLLRCLLFLLIRLWILSQRMQIADGWCSKIEILFQTRSLLHCSQPSQLSYGMEQGIGNWINSPPKIRSVRITGCAFSLCCAPLLTTLQLMKGLWTSVWSTLPVYHSHALWATAIGLILPSYSTCLCSLVSSCPDFLILRTFFLSPFPHNWDLTHGLGPEQGYG